MKKKDGWVIKYTYLNPREVNNPRWRFYKKDQGDIMIYSNRRIAKRQAESLKKIYPKIYYRVKSTDEINLKKR